MTDNYKQAVEFAKDFFRPQIVDGRFSQYSVEPTEFLYMFGLPIEQRKDDHGFCPTYYCFPEHALRFLFLHAVRDKGAYDILRRIVASRLFRGDTLSDTERMFAGQIIAGVFVPPPSEAKRLSKSFANTINILFATRYVIERFGLGISSGAESLVRISACDAVSDALASLGVHQTSNSIRNIVNHPSSRRARHIADAVIQYQADRWDEMHPKSKINTD